jgi:hypothetical protein
MADTKLSALTECTSIGDTDELYINDSGTSKRTLWSTIKTALASVFHSGATGTAAYFPMLTSTTAGHLVPAVGVNIDAPGQISLSIVKYADPASDHTATGDVETVTVGESVAFPDLLFCKSDSKWWKADADAATTMPGMRMALETKDADAACVVLEKGYARDDSWAFTTGALIYASCTAGAYTMIQPSGTGDIVQAVGQAAATTKMKFNPSPVLVEIT